MRPVDLGMPAVTSATAPTDDVAHSQRPSRHAGLLDRHGRAATDLRLSLLDRCNLRCAYCMPANGLDWTPKAELLTAAEIVRLARIAVGHLGVTSIRLTGGEPLLHRGVVNIVGDLAPLTDVHGTPVDLSLTTNGIWLGQLARPLADAGLRRVNVSLDTLRPERFRELTRRDRLDDVLAGLAAARRAGLDPVKVNAVLLRGINHDEAPDLLRWALHEGFQLRFIEQMPLDAQGAWDRSQMVSAREVLDSLGDHFSLTPDDPRTRHGAPAETFRVAATPNTPAGRVGIVASVTRPFCGDCVRTRITADGRVRACLFSHAETDLRGLVRSGADDHDIAQRWRDAMWHKPAGHNIAADDFRQPDRPMSAIGG